MVNRNDHAAAVSKVARVYNFLAQFGEGGAASDYLHVGLFDGENDELAAAQDRLVREISRKLQIGGQSHLVDIGCGVGRPMIEISRHFGCRVTGITIAEVQAAQARELIARNTLDARVRAIVADAHRLPFATGAFDGAIALESLLHMNRATALGEIGRVVRPGGSFVLCDFYELQPLTNEEIKALERQMCMNTVNLAQYRDLLSAAGFSNPKVVDWTSAVLPTYVHWSRFKTDPGSPTPPNFVARYNAIASSILPIIGAKLGYLCMSATRA